MDYLKYIASPRSLNYSIPDELDPLIWDNVYRRGTGPSKWTMIHRGQRYTVIRKCLENIWTAWFCHTKTNQRLHSMELWRDKRVTCNLHHFYYLYMSINCNYSGQVNLAWHEQMYE